MLLANAVVASARQWSPVVESRLGLVNFGNGMFVSSAGMKERA